jgi:DNA-binding NtrC family response regulator
LRIPPLRERREDILPLAEHFLRKHEPKSQRGLFQISPELSAQLSECEWPGNVRELENFMRRALALSTGTALGVQVLDAAEGSASGREGSTLKSGVTLQDMERQLLEKTLEATGGNRTRAAELMGVSLRTVRNKIRTYGLPARRPV